MKKLIFLLIGISILLLPIGISANSSTSLEDILGEIMKFQGVSEKSQIKCDKVTDGQFEELGEAVMGVMHPDEKQHELMDQMMGGEGSDSLKAMHTLMGKRYLGCVSGMMAGGGMMNMMGDWSNPMMNFGYWSGFGWLGSALIILSLIFLIVATIALIKWLINQNKKP